MSLASDRYDRSDTRNVTRLLVIDDDRELCALLHEFLRREGLAVEFANSGRAGLDRLWKATFDLVVLDIMLPEVDGFDVLRWIRRQAEIPVIMLTARGEDEDRIVGLELGADDYLSKPFNPRELLARIRAVMRRLQRQEQGVSRIEVNNVVLDSGTREAYCNGRALGLTTVEFEILEMLMRAAGQAVTRDEIMGRLYDRDAGPMERAVDMHVSHIRRKLGQSGVRIKTIRGEGYQFLQSS